MRILRGYILKELLQPSAMALLLFTFVMLVGNLVKLADLLVNKGISPLDILQLFGLLIPSLLIYTVPMALLTGTLLAFGKLSSDREILAMKASGIGLFPIALPVLIVGLLVSLAMVPINAEAVPWSHFVARQLGVKVVTENPTAFLEPGRFIKEFKPYILFIYQINGNQMSKVRIYEPREDGPTRTIVAERGEFLPVPDENRVVLKLYDGAADEPDPKIPSKFYKLEFQTYAMNLRLKGGQDPRTLDKKPKDMSLQELRDEVHRLALQGIDPAPLEMELHRRIAMAFSPLVFILIGLPLGITTRRAQRSIGLGISVLIFVGYYLLLIGGQALGQKGWLPPGPALWLANGVMGTVGGILLWRAARS
ncbi:MAG: LPS export ABC transporter permease LptF [Candidatus Omnitrophica bacterium CG11_big_fil_rev_8_21_14_0_20_64_10]|nr:MAG: LPS export ABC transporter permease LptF [Candidatus Omnitrophica bacterium CG11_big_fil_rev_8_21_14_0_20_64_10]